MAENEKILNTPKITATVNTRPSAFTDLPKIEATVKTKQDVLELPKISMEVKQKEVIVGNLGTMVAGKGKDGKDGADGYTPVKGLDYFDGKDGLDGKDGVDGYTPIKGVDYFDGKDGIDGKDGQDGKDGYTPRLGIDYFNGKDGRDGVDGKPGKDGKNGRTPIKGIDYKDGKDGKDGLNGLNGIDGFSPKVSVEEIEGGHKITITDKDGEKSFDVMDGQGVNGDGGTGENGFSPTISVEEIENGHKITITDIDGTKTIDVLNGTNGIDGKDGYTPVKGVDYFDGEPGADGKDGSPGADGYTPQKGVDYWTTEDIQSMVADAVNGVLAQKSNILKTAFPVGSEYVMSENKNPADVLGFGTWELVGKGFKDAQGSSASSFFTEDTTNTDTCTVYYRRSGNTMWLKFALKTLVAAAETNLTFGTLKLSELGVANIASTTWHTFPFCGENGIVLCSLTAAGKLTSVDVVIKGSGTSVAAASTIYGQYTLVLRAEDMMDSFCDKFYWKRTA